MKRLKIFTILFIIILIGSCENGSNNENEINDLKDINWILIGFQSQDTHKMEFKPANLIEMGIGFHDDNWFYAQSSCNIIYGYYTLGDPDILQTDSLNQTLFPCKVGPEAEWEGRYYNELQNAKNYHIVGNYLIIATKLNTNIIFIVE